MGSKTGIEWTEATWNPVRGCTRVSEGCRNCYAERVASRFSGPGMPYEGLAQVTPSGPRWTGQVRLVEEHLEDPIRWKKPRRIFVNSMSDLFHEGLSDAQIDRVFAVMAMSPHHTFQVLTKRPERMLEYLTAPIGFSLRRKGRVYSTADEMRAQLPRTQQRQIDTQRREWPLPNVWLGTSAEDQKTADQRIPLLLQTPAAVRFISAEPLLGPIDLTRVAFRDNGKNPSHWDYECWWLDALAGAQYKGDQNGDVDVEINRLDWVIVGGESGPGARPMHPNWPIAIRDQCQDASVPFFFKQHGGWSPDSVSGEQCGYSCHLWPDGAMSYRVGKKRAGRILDGREWSEFPGVVP